jgi:histidinol phosphatase-like enzyme
MGYTLVAAFISSLMAVSVLALVPTRILLPKLVLLDRDGVINEDVGPPGVICKSQFRLTYCAGKAIGSLKRCGCRVAIITNQSCVGKGLLAIEELNYIHSEMQHVDSARSEMQQS